MFAALVQLPRKTAFMDYYKTKYAAVVSSLVVQ